MMANGSGRGRRIRRRRTGFARPALFLLLASISAAVPASGLVMQIKLPSLEEAMLKLVRTLPKVWMREERSRRSPAEFKEACADRRPPPLRAPSGAASVAPSRLLSRGRSVAAAQSL